MRIFHVTSKDAACKIAGYLITNRIVFHPSYTWPDKIKGPARFTFRLVRHIADNPTEMDLLNRFLDNEAIKVEREQ